MPSGDIKRVNYSERQFLRPQDFQDEQAYHIDMRRRHNIAHHTWGIVAGLDLEEQAIEGAEEVNVYVKPGMAVDGFGREIFVVQPYKLNPEDGFKPFNTKRHLEVWISYNQELADRPPAGYEVCDVKDQFIRLRENFKIKVGPQTPPHDAVVIAGERKIPPTIPSDESIPYQELPEDGDNPRWLVRVGSVSWDGVNQKFLKAPTEVLLIAGRNYVGNVAAEIQAPVGELVIKDRFAQHPLPPAHRGAAVTLDGSLTTERWVLANHDVYVHGNVGIGLNFSPIVRPNTRLHITDGNSVSLDNGGGYLVIGALIGRNLVVDDHAILARIDDSGKQVKSALHLQPIGGELVVHQDQAGSQFVINDSGQVGIGTFSPEHNLQIGNASATVSMSLRGPDVNSASGVLAFEDNGGTGQRWFKLTHDTDKNLLKITSKEVAPIMIFDRIEGKVGIGTEAPNRRLTIQGNEGTYLNVKASDGAFEVLLGADGNGGIVSTMTNHDLQLRAGNNDTKMIIKANGNVGVGTTNPTLKLDIQGDFGRTNGPATLNLFGSQIVDTGGGILFLRSGGNVTAFESGDKVGIGTFSPSHSLDVVGAARFRPSQFTNLLISQVGPFNDDIALEFIKHTDTTPSGRIVFNGFQDQNTHRASLHFYTRGPTDSDVVERMQITDNGSVGIAMAPNPNVKLDVNGLIRADNVSVPASDARLKTNVKQLTDALGKLEKVRGVSFDWNDLCESLGLSSNRREIGLIAQEVEKVFPELVTTWGNESYKAIEYGRLTAVLVEAVKELKQKVETMEKPIEKKRRTASPE